MIIINRNGSYLDFSEIYGMVKGELYLKTKAGSQFFQWVSEYDYILFES